ncbi:right-handed parallel beta-helix repeat-containing protein [bacterium]|nr:right-handed parallel beta-helix repeat-containing protein [bacterium]
MRTIRASFWQIVLAAFLAGSGGAATIQVPKDYATIQQALNVSGVGDTVLVGPGTYSDYAVQAETAAVARLPDGVVLKSEQGPSTTVIDLGPLEGVAYWAIAFGISGHSSGQTVVDGFHVVNLPPNSNGASIGASGHVEVRNCVFEVTAPAPTTYQTGITTLGVELVVSGCTFLRCQSMNGGAGIAHSVGDLTVEACTFTECGTGGALLASSGGVSTPQSLVVRDCLFQRCVTTQGGGGIGTGQTGGVLIDNCTFEDMEAIGTSGAAAYLLGGGLRTISNCTFRSMDLPDGVTCIFVQSGLVSLTGNTFVDLHQAPRVVPYAVVLGTTSVGPVVFENNIVANTSGGEVLEVPAGSTTSCNVFWDNADGIGLDLDPTDRIADPQFCDADNGDYTLMATSPCLPALSLGCDLIGALGQGCGTVSLTPETWGRIKAGFRTGEEE